MLACAYLILNPNRLNPEPERVQAYDCLLTSEEPPNALTSVVLLSQKVFSGCTASHLKTLGEHVAAIPGTHALAHRKLVSAKFNCPNAKPGARVMPSAQQRATTHVGIASSIVHAPSECIPAKAADKSRAAVVQLLLLLQHLAPPLRMSLQPPPPPSQRPLLLLGL